MNTDTGMIYFTPEGVEAAKERGERVTELEEDLARALDRIQPAERPSALNRFQRRRQQFGNTR